MRRLLSLLLATCGILSAAPEHTGLLSEAAAALKAGDNATALVRLEAAAKLRPDYPRIQINLARLYAAAGQPDDALAALDRIAAMGVSLNVGADPGLAPLYDLPRFQALVARLTGLSATVQGDLTAQ